MKNILFVVGVAIAGAAVSGGAMYVSLKFVCPWMLKHLSVFVAIAGVLGALRMVVEIKAPRRFKF
ncbi:MAG: hypothetical protein WDZ40_03990 [Candidatus Spechtbacterales bacterium]